MVRYRVLVSGRVQGVFFRDSCRRVAEEHDVGGWVRNLPDGRVEAVFEGPPSVQDIAAHAVVALGAFLEHERADAGGAAGVGHGQPRHRAADHDHVGVKLTCVHQRPTERPPLPLEPE